MAGVLTPVADALWASHAAGRVTAVFAISHAVFASVLATLMARIHTRT